MAHVAREELVGAPNVKHNHDGTLVVEGYVPAGANEPQAGDGMEELRWNSVPLHS